MFQINYKDVVKNEDITYYHNPFGGIEDEEVLFVLQPKYPIDEWIKILEKEHPVIIQFVGSKGRGKTTHLKALFQHVNKAVIYYLDRIQKKVKERQSNIVFIDSVGRISFFDRMRLWRKKNTSYIITTHRNRKIEFWLSKRSYKTYYFKGLHKKDLKNIIRYRVVLASDISFNQIQIPIKSLDHLIDYFGDDYRGILNFLYDTFNQYHGTR